MTASAPANPMRATAAEWKAADCSVIPIKADGTKAPPFPWASYEVSVATDEEIDTWFSSNYGLGVIGGRVSGNLEWIDFDHQATYEEYRATAIALGYGDLVERIEAGYLEQTPKPGFHWPYRCATIAGNTKLAQHLVDGERKAKIETRGEGGYCVVAPSNGRGHETGRPYVLLRGSPATIATITPDERAVLHALAKSLDELPPAEHAERGRSEGRLGGRPGDDFNTRSTWREVLEPHGWREVYSRGEITYWRRPGKERGWSATTNYAGSGYLYVFSSSTEFETERGYNKFSAYALLNHAGDFSAAARALGALGYGEPASGFTSGGQRVDPETGEVIEPVGERDEVLPPPLEALPPSLEAYVRESAASLSCPADFVAVPLLAAIGAAVGSARELAIKPDWREGTNLYTAQVGDPGSKKSPALDKATAALAALQKSLAADFYQREEQYKIDLAEWEKQDKDTRGDRPDEPVFEDVFTTDSTMEALGVSLFNSQGVLLMRDELVGWIRDMDAYRSGKGGDRQRFLTFWSRGMVKINRKSTRVPLVIPRPCLAVTGGVQPDVLLDLGDAAGREDGFVDRINWSFPDAMPDRWSDHSIDPSTALALTSLFARLRALTPEFDLNDERVLVALSFTVEAAATFRQWYDANAAEMADPAFWPRLRGPWAKMPAQLARLALILALARDPATRTVDEDAVLSACAWAAYFKSHARRVYRRLRIGGGKLGAGGRILRYLREHGPTMQSELSIEVFKRSLPVERLQAELEDLETKGLVRHYMRDEPEATGRKPVMWEAVDAAT